MELSEDKKDTQIAEQSRLIQELIRRLTCEWCGTGLDEGPGLECIDDHPAYKKKQREKMGLHKDQPTEIIVCDECRKTPAQFKDIDPMEQSLVEVWTATVEDSHLCGGCRYNKKMAALLGVPFIVYPSEVGYGKANEGNEEATN